MGIWISQEMIKKNSCEAPINCNPANKQNLESPKERTTVVKINKRCAVDLPGCSSLCNQYFLTAPPSFFPESSPFFSFSPFFFFFSGPRCYLPGQAITSLCCSSHQQHGFSLLSLTSATWLPCLLQLVPRMERGPPHFLGAASSSNAISRKTKYPLALQRGSTNMPLFGRAHECKECEHWVKSKCE